MARIYKSPYPDVSIPDIALHTLILKGLDASGPRPRIIDSISGTSWSGPQLARNIRQFAFGLHLKGLNQGDVVAVLSPNTIWYPVIVFGAVAASALVTTLNPTYTPDEVAYQLNDAGASVLFYSPMLEEAVKAAVKLVPGMRRVIAIGSPEFEAIAKSPEGKLPQRSLKPSRDLCLLPYSSGTTGLAKGVMLSHRNVVANIVQVSELYVNDPNGLNETDVACVVLPMYHIYGLGVLLCTALHRGATLVVFPKFDLEQFLTACQHYKITRLYEFNPDGLHFCVFVNFSYIVPPIVLALAKHPIVAKFDLSHVKQVNSGAAPLGEELANQCAARLKCQVTQGYGMTELSPVSHFPPPTAMKIASVGLMVPNMEARVVDAETGKDAPEGGVGELWLRGPNVMVGYWRNEEATRITIDSEGWLHTGDVAQIDKEHYYYIVDRVKELIKFKGLQVAPAELEALLLAHPKIADAAVVPFPDIEAGELPKAFIVKRDIGLTAEEVMDYIKAKVAYHKRIRLVEFIDVIPKAPSGKILRRFLRDRDRKATAPAAKL